MISKYFLFFEAFLHLFKTWISQKHAEVGKTDIIVSILKIQILRFKLVKRFAEDLIIGSVLFHNVDEMSSWLIV